jgi:hypothetical protein
MVIFSFHRQVIDRTGAEMRAGWARGARYIEKARTKRATHVA